MLADISCYIGVARGTDSPRGFLGC